MDKKAQLGLVVFLMLVNTLVGIVAIVIYYDHLKARSCNSDSECGKNSFCDENSRCQFQETIIKNSKGTVTVQKHNIKWGVLFIVISLIASALILRPRKRMVKTH